MASLDPWISKQLQTFNSPQTIDCLLHVGFNEDGTCQNLSAALYSEQIRLLTVLTYELHSKIKVLLERIHEKHDCTRRANNECHEGWILVRKRPESVNNLGEVRVVVMGNVDAGKSTLVGVLTKGVLDDGRGRARLNLFRHKHEFDSGRISSIGQEILGFDEHFEPICGN